MSTQHKIGFETKRALKGGIVKMLRLILVAMLVAVFATGCLSTTTVTETINPSGPPELTDKEAKAKVLHFIGAIQEENVDQVTKFIKSSIVFNDVYEENKVLGKSSFASMMQEDFNYWDYTSWRVGEPRVSRAYGQVLVVLYIRYQKEFYNPEPEQKITVHYEHWNFTFSYDQDDWYMTGWDIDPYFDD